MANLSEKFLKLMDSPGATITVGILLLITTVPITIALYTLNMGFYFSRKAIYGLVFVSLVVIMHFLASTTRSSVARPETTTENGVPHD